MPEGNEGNTNTPAGGGSEVKTFTQDEVNRIVDERLKRERAKFSDYDELKRKAAEADTSKSELQKLTETVNQLKDDLTEERHKSLRTDVAQAKGLSAAQARRLTGKSREELEADADDMIATFGIKKPSEEGEPGGNDGQKTGDTGQSGKDGGAGDGSAKDALRKSPTELREGTVPNAASEKTGEQLAEEVWKRTHGGL